MFVYTRYNIIMVSSNYLHTTCTNMNNIKHLFLFIFTFPWLRASTKFELFEDNTRIGLRNEKTVQSNINWVTTRPQTTPINNLLKQKFLGDGIFLCINLWGRDTLCVVSVSQVRNVENSTQSRTHVAPLV